jgi:hypothetical protein
LAEAGERCLGLFRRQLGAGSRSAEPQQAPQDRAPVQTISEKLGESVECAVIHPVALR